MAGDQKETLKCSECGTDFVRPGSRGPIPTRCTECKTDRKRRRHATEQRHREERRKQGRYRCGHCGKVRPGDEFARSQRKDGAWCRACFKATYIERSGGLETRECTLDECNETFKATKRSRRAYCSRRCKDRAMTLRMLEGKREAKRGRICENPECGQEIPVEKMANARYCSETCRRVHAGPGIRRRAMLKAAYGMTVEDYDALLVAQGGGCAICGVSEHENGVSLHVDHDHATGKVRGILCSACNFGLGKFGDNPDNLRRAAEYLSR